MTFNNLLPILIPGVLIQVAVQAYYIKHCWDNPRLDKRRKAAWIIAIALLNLIAAAFYLLLTRPRSSAEPERDQKEQQIDSQTRQGIFVLLVISFEVMGLRVINENIDSSGTSLLTLLMGICFACLIIDGLLEKKRSRLVAIILPLLQIILILAIYYIDIGQMTQFMVMVILAGIINNQKLNRVISFSIPLFVGYLVLHIIKLVAKFGTLNSDDAISLLYVNLLIFVLVFAAFYSLKKQLLANQNLQSAIEMLRQQSLELEEMSTLAERNRIVGEIHDTVGHTLTTSIIAIEAAKNTLNQNDALAVAKLDLATEQVRRGLQDLRNSVRTIKDGVEIPFKVKLENLFNTIKSSTDLTITEIVELELLLLPIQQNVLLNAIREFTTNSLKHGQSTEIDILLQEYKQNIQLTMSDNGKGTANIIPGFGLKNIAQQVSSLGGTYNADSEPDEGFSLTISIPTGSNTGDESN